jgi:site-specific recombinase XerD
LYAPIVHAWVESAGLESSAYGTHSMRRTKAAQIYKKTGNLRAVQLLLGHTKLESTVRYLGIEVDEALSTTSSTVAPQLDAASRSLRPVSTGASRRMGVRQCFDRQP